MSVTELLSFESTRLFVPHTDLDGNSVRVRTLSSPIRHLSSRTYFYATLDWMHAGSMYGIAVAGASIPVGRDPLLCGRVRA